MRRLILLMLVLVLFVFISLATWFGWRFIYSPIPPIHSPITIYVPPRTSMQQLAWDLYQRGALKNPYYFLLLAKWQGQYTRIKSGEYSINPEMTTQELLQKMVQGKVLLHKITIVEGWTFQQVLQALAKNPLLSHSLSNQSLADIMQDLGYPENNPEGLFYPSTYLFAKGTSDRKILRMAYQLMEKKLNQAWAKRSAAVNLNTPYEALIVASLVEKETAQSIERPQIAAVILRRLALAMPLQIDATIIYGLGSHYKNPLTRADLRTNTEYNTYLHKGLPPTPISMPSELSIQAVMHPSETKALYYVAQGDGSQHVFSNDLLAHNKAVSQYRANKKLLRWSVIPPCVSAKLMVNYWHFLAN